MGDLWQQLSEADNHVTGIPPAGPRVGQGTVAATGALSVSGGGNVEHITVPKIVLHHIANVEKLPITSLGCPLILRCKNFWVAHFVLDSHIVCHDVYNLLLNLSQPALPEDLYAFSYNPKSSKEMKENGWKLIDPISDFGRMGIPNRYWIITEANRNYEKLQAHDEPPKEVCTCSELGNLLSQHLGSSLTNPLDFMGIDGYLNTLMENGTISSEGGFQAQMDQVKIQCADFHHDCCGIIGSLRAINISGDMGFSGNMGISESRGIYGATGISGNVDISETMDCSENISISGSMGIFGDTGISKASTKEAGCYKQQELETHHFHPNSKKRVEQIEDPQLF
ncbi:phosphatidylinositol-3,5-bisphosphate 3-phosphatase MTMR8 [Herpailurus yagouaroundi]|uniref:phosphatidylinositol-3,5-bisphosphate 3-phosphatase MTMR8 n=1 Tax=Herpailurus yagouaroundi TaxID=1608482 RepID=UPI001AD630A7|nr:myotubularin-related protein 8 [Puma yagouaroundi]